MKVKPSVAALAVFAATLGACTTTKDLERRPEFVPVEIAKAQASGAAATQRGGGGEQASAATSESATGKPAAGTQGDRGATAGGTSTQSAGNQKPTADTADGLSNVAPASREGSAPAEASPAVPPVVVEKKIYIEKPIYYPESAERTPQSPGDSVMQALSRGVMKPKDYNGALMLYDYDSSLVYQVYAMPLRVTDIYLEPGEKLIEQPFCGDTSRWNIGGGVSKAAGVDTQHLYLKPAEEGLETTLIINTDRRIYHLIIKSFKDTFMLAVMWHYPGLGMPLDFLPRDNQRNDTSEHGGRQSSDQGESSPSAIGIDPVLMSSDYTVSYPKGNPPQWLPTLVLDDGAKTYVVLPDTVIHHELPAAFGENGEIVNFRVKDNVIVIDRLLRKVQLKLRDVTVEIKKKGGSR